MTRGGILGVRCREHLLISSSTLPGLGRVSAKNVNKLTDFNAAVSSLGYDKFLWDEPICGGMKFFQSGSSKYFQPRIGDSNPSTLPSFPTSSPCFRTLHPKEDNLLFISGINLMLIYQSVTFPAAFDK